MYGSWVLGGDAGLGILTALSAFALLVLLGLTLRRLALSTATVASVVACVGLLVQGRYSMARPMMLGAVALAATLYLCTRTWRAAADRSVWAAPAIVAVWTFVHSTAIVGLALLVVFAFAALVVRHPARRAFAAATLVAVAVTVALPSGRERFAVAAGLDNASLGGRAHRRVGAHPPRHARAVDPARRHARRRRRRARRPRPRAPPRRAAVPRLCRPRRRPRVALRAQPVRGHPARHACRCARPRARRRGARTPRPPRAALRRARRRPRPPRVAAAPRPRRARPRLRRRPCRWRRPRRDAGAATPPARRPRHERLHARRLAHLAKGAGLLRRPHRRALPPGRHRAPLPAALRRRRHRRRHRRSLRHPLRAGPLRQRLPGHAHARARVLGAARLRSRRRALRAPPLRRRAPARRPAARRATLRQRRALARPVVRRRRCRSRAHRAPRGRGRARRRPLPGQPHAPRHAALPWRRAARARRSLESARSTPANAVS